MFVKDRTGNEEAPIPPERGDPRAGRKLVPVLENFI